MGIFPLLQGFGGTIPTKEWVPPLVVVEAEGNILPEEEVFGGLMGDGDGEPEAVSSAATESSEEMMVVEVVLGDQTIPLLPGAALPVRQEARVQNMKKSLSDAGSEAQKRAVRPMRVIWPPRTRRPLHLRKEYSPRSLLLPHHQEPPLHQPQPASLQPEADESSLPEGCHHVGAEGVGDLPRPFAQAGALQASPWLLRSLPQVLCHQTRSL